MLRYKNIDISSRLNIVKNKIEIKRAFDEYLKWGGYFSVISNNNEELKKELLKNIAEDIILKDIAPRYNIKNSQQLRDMFYYLATNASNILNYSSLSKKLNIDAKSIKEYIMYFEDNFLITSICKYHHKASEQIKSAKKIYLNDNGFLNLSMDLKQNLGMRLENLVFNTLYINDENLMYIKDNYEIDFYSKNTIFQVSYDMRNEKTRKRELNAFSHFRFNEHTKARLLTYDIDEIMDDVEVLSYISYVLSD